VLENVADGIVTVTGDGVIHSFNRAAAELSATARRRRSASRCR